MTINIPLDKIKFVNNDNLCCNNGNIEYITHEMLWSHNFYYRFKSINRPFHNEEDKFYLMIENDNYIITIFFNAPIIWDDKRLRYTEKHTNLNKLLKYFYENEQINKVVVFGIRFVKSQDGYYITIKDLDFKTNLIPPKDINKVIVKVKKYAFIRKSV